jgi:hypothetical protein
MNRVLLNELSDWPIPELGRIGLPGNAPAIELSAIPADIPFPVPVCWTPPDWPAALAARLRNESNTLETEA